MVNFKSEYRSPLSTAVRSSAIAAFAEMSFHGYHLPISETDRLKTLLRRMVIAHELREKLRGKE